MSQAHKYSATSLNPLTMDFFSFPALLTLVLMVVMLFIIMAKMKEEGLKTGKKLTPPEPWKLPLIGHLHHLLVSLPHHALTDLAKKHGPIMKLQLGEFSMLVISSAGLAKELMKTHDTSFLNRPQSLAATVLTYEGQNIGFAPYGEYWRHVRKICTLQLLSAKRVQSFGSVREEEVQRFVRSISQSAGSVVNLSEKVFLFANDVIATSTFGKKWKDREAFISAMHEAMKMTISLGLVDVFPSIKPLHIFGAGMKRKLDAVQMKIDKILEKALEEHRATKLENKGEPGELIDNNLVDVLLSVQQGSNDLHVPLTNTNLKAIIADMMEGGSDTSGTVIEWAMSELMKNPSVMKKAQEEVRRVCDGKLSVNEEDLHELNYLKCVIKETLRLRPPLPLLLPRESSERCEIGGYEIPKKTRVIVNFRAIGRDPQYWKDAERFIPERFDGSSIDYKGNNFEFIPFGAGRRICPGFVFGLASVEIALAKLLYHFDWELPNGMKPEELDMTEMFGGTIRKRTNLKLIPKLYTPCDM